MNRNFHGTFFLDCYLFAIIIRMQRRKIKIYGKKNKRMRSIAIINKKHSKFILDISSLSINYHQDLHTYHIVSWILGSSWISRDSTSCKVTAATPSTRSSSSKSLKQRISTYSKWNENNLYPPALLLRSFSKLSASRDWYAAKCA